MRRLITVLAIAVCALPCAAADESNWSALEKQFREMPMEARRLTGPLFWLHGDDNETKDRLEMYLGKVAEVGPTEALYTGSRHPYTTALLGSLLSMYPDNRRTEAPLAGDPPNPINPPPGCRFHTRCAFAEGVCKERAPSLATAGAGHLAACHMAAAGSGHSKAPGVAA